MTCPYVASTPDAASMSISQALHMNFSNRPPNAGATHLAYVAQDMVFAHYGPRWKLLRKLSNLHTLISSEVKSSTRFAISEVRCRVVIEFGYQFIYEGAYSL